jgi:DNA-binding GntR family transcriptional regulator
MKDLVDSGAGSDGHGGPSKTRRDGQDVAHVYERLRERILRGDIPAGQSTSQVTLARDLGVGRTPLREALRMLQRDGLVISEPNRLVRVASLSQSDAAELYLMRIALETLAIRITVPTLTSDDFAVLEGYMAQMDHYMRTGDQRGMQVPHAAFHDLLVSGAGQRVSQMISELSDHSERYRREFGAHGLWERRREEHRAILEAAADRNADLAAELLAAHYVHTLQLIFAGVEHPKLDGLHAALAVLAPGAANTLTVD